MAAEEAGAETIEIEGRDVDVPLSALGERQARALGQWFARQPDQERPSLILSSPYARARQTSALLAGELPDAKPRCMVDERLREKEFGALNRFTKAGILARFPEEARRRADIGKFYYRPPGGESWCDVVLRLRTVAHDLCSRFADEERVLIVAHQVVVLCFRYIFEGLDEAHLLEVDRAAEVANCSITSYREDPNGGLFGLELLRYNFVAPLEQAGEPVTAAPDPAAVK